MLAIRHAPYKYSVSDAPILYVYNLVSIDTLTKNVEDICNMFIRMLEYL